METRLGFLVCTNSRATMYLPQQGPLIPPDFTDDTWRTAEDSTRAFFHGSFHGFFCASQSRASGGSGKLASATEHPSKASADSPGPSSLGTCGPGLAAPTFLQAFSISLVNTSVPPIQPGLRLCQMQQAGTSAAMDAPEDQCGALRDPGFVNLVISMYVWCTGAGPCRWWPGSPFC